LIYQPPTITLFQETEQNIKMKKIASISTFLLLLSAYSYGQKENIQTTTIKGQGNAPDTVITRKTELLFGKTYPNNYKRDEIAVQVLRPYLVSDIVNPANQSHPRYLDRTKEAREILPEAKAGLLALMKVSSTTREFLAKINIVNEADLQAITFAYIPVYYPTPDIVFFKNGENIAKYYNLGRGALKYLMLRNNMLVGFLNYNPDYPYSKSQFFPVRPPDLASYNQIIKLGKTPIGLKQSISLDQKYVGGDGVHMLI